MSALWQICQGLRVEQVELERTAALFDITCEMQARLAKPGSNGRLTVFQKLKLRNSVVVSIHDET